MEDGLSGDIAGLLIRSGVDSPWVQLLLLPLYLISEVMVTNLPPKEKDRVRFLALVYG